MVKTVQDPMVIPLWENVAPGFENRRNEPEIAKDYWVKNIHNPTLTVYRPAAEMANGTAIIIAPGGGHSLLVAGEEGRSRPNTWPGSASPPSCSNIVWGVARVRLTKEDGGLVGGFGLLDAAPVGRKVRLGSRYP